MRTKHVQFIAALVLCSIGIVFIHTQYTSHSNSIIFINAEALSEDENPSGKGRWKTVACDGEGFSGWRTYCCPSDYYDNCDGRIGTCPHYPDNGCQDTFWY